MAYGNKASAIVNALALTCLVRPYNQLKSIVHEKHKEAVPYASQL
jgi:hypothetical protein